MAVLESVWRFLTQLVTWKKGWSHRGTVRAGAAGQALRWFSASRCRFPLEAVRRSRTMISIKKILYPTDFSSYSNQAYFHALGLAEMYGASLTVVYVHAPGTVVRCPSCEQVLMRIVRQPGRGRYWLDLSGVRCLEFAEG